MIWGSTYAVVKTKRPSEIAVDPYSPFDASILNASILSRSLNSPAGDVCSHEVPCPPFRTRFNIVSMGKSGVPAWRKPGIEAGIAGATG
jgi:hypothetical protein